MMICTSIITSSQNKKDQGDPDIVNPIYRKEYERAYTDRKVKNFQTKLNEREEKEQRSSL